MPEPTVDLKRCGELIERRQYPELFELLAPFLEKGLSRDRRLTSLPGSDHVENVMLELAEKLLRSDGSKLNGYLIWQDNHPEKTLLDWLRIVRRNLVNSYMEERLRKGKTHTGNLREVLGEIEHLFGSRRPRFTRYRLVGRITEVAEAVLSERQLAAFRLWLQGYSPKDVGQELGCDAEEAERLVDAAKVRLKRQFEDELDE